MLTTGGLITGIAMICGIGVTIGTCVGILGTFLPLSLT